MAHHKVAPTRKAYGELAVLSAGMFAVGTDCFVIAPLLPRIAGDLGINLAEAAQLITIYALSYAFFSPIVAVLTTRWPRERALTIGLAIFVLANIGVYIGPNFLSVLLARALTGLGAAIFAPMASATASSLLPAEQRGRALSILMVGLGGATALGAPIGTLISTVTTWRVVFLLIAVLATAVVCGIGRNPQRGEVSTKLSLADCLNRLRERPVVVTLLTTFFVLSGLYISYTYIAVIFDRVTDGAGTIMALLQSVWGVAGILGLMIAGRLTDRWGSRAVACMAMIVVFIDFAVLPWTSAHLTTAIMAVFVWGICGWGFTVPQQHRLIQNAPQAAPVALGLYAMTVYGGTSTSAIVGAAGLHFIGRHQLPLIGAGLILAGLALELIARRKGHDPAYAI